MLTDPGSTHPSRLLRLASATARTTLWLVAAVWLLFALSWGALHGWIVPRVEEWRPAMERLATQALGVRVTLGEVRAESRGPIPALEFRDVRLHDAQGREALHLSRVLAALSAQSLWRLGFEQLLIENPVLDVRRTADGRIELAGMPLTAQDSDSGLADWFFDQREFAIRGGEIRWTDETRPELEPLVLRDIDFVARNPGRQHHLRIDATPPPEWGQRFSVRGRFSRPLWQAQASDWAGWSGNAYADFPYADVRHLQAYLDLLDLTGVSLEQGAGAVRGWAELQRGELVNATTDVALQAVALRWRDRSTALALSDLSGRLDLALQGSDTRLASQGLAFRTGDGVVWPGGNFQLVQRHDAQGRLTEGRLQADRLDLTVLHQLFGHLPVAAETGLFVASTRPEGLVEQLVLDWQLPADPAHHTVWSATGKIRQLALAPGETPLPYLAPEGWMTHPLGRPGLRGANVDFSIQPEGGKVSVDLRQGDVTFPGLYDEPRVPFDRLQGEIAWKLKDAEMEIDIQRLVFANADTEGDLRGRWRSADPQTRSSVANHPGVIALNGRLRRADAARVHRYLPLSMSASVRDYVRQAVRAGRASEVTFDVQGDLARFPFALPQTGVFDVRARLADLTLAYVPDEWIAADRPRWPALQGLQAELRIDRSSLAVLNASGTVDGAPLLRLTGAQARLPDFMSAAPMLQVGGQVQGPGTDALAFVNRSPVGEFTGGVLAQARSTGNLQLGLELAIPLGSPEATRVQGVLRLPGNDLRFTPDAPLLQAMTGSLSFTESGFQVPAATTRLLGGELRFSGGSLPGPEGRTVRFTGQGTALAAGLRRAQEWPWLAPLAERLSGSAPYQAKLEFTPLGMGLRVESALVGMALDAPPPLAKSAGAVLPLLVERTPLPPESGSTNRTRDEWRVELGAGTVPLLSVRYQRSHGEALGDTRVLRGALGLRSERLPLPVTGVNAVVAVDLLDVDAWRAAFEAPAGSATSVGNAHDYWPTSLALSARRLEESGRAFHEVSLGATREGTTWRVSADAQELNGYLEYRPSSDRQSGRVYARLARLTLPAAAAQDVESYLVQPRFVPAVDVEVEQFELNGRRLGRLKIDAGNTVPTQTGPTVVASTNREWQLRQLRLQVPEATLTAQGRWSPQAATGVPRTELQLNLAVEDAGLLLARFGMPGVLRGGQGRLEGQVDWQGSPLSFNTQTLSGALALDVQRGQFLKADPGLAKLLGVLSLQALPRRLVFDFRDVFSEGFAFDHIRGDATIARGVASTRNLRMQGVSALVLLEGTADTVNETQDLSVLVVPEFNAGTASLMAALVNPMAGVGSMLAQLLLGTPFKDAATRQFQVSGPWADPQVERVARRNIPPESPPPSQLGVPP